MLDMTNIGKLHITPKRYETLILKSRFPFIMTLALELIRNIIWGSMRLEFLRRGAYRDLVPWLNECIEKSVLKTLQVCANLEDRNERFIFKALSTYYHNSQQTNGQPLMEAQITEFIQENDINKRLLNMRHVYLNKYETPEHRKIRLDNKSKEHKIIESFIIPITNRK
jgi:hypothetical protein